MEKARSDIWVLEPYRLLDVEVDGGLKPLEDSPGSYVRVRAGS
jgi:hypothetical protein